MQQAKRRPCGARAGTRVHWTYHNVRGVLGARRARPGVVAAEQEKK